MRREDSLCAQPSPLAFGSLVRRLSVVRLSSATGCSCDLYVRCNQGVPEAAVELPFSPSADSTSMEVPTSSPS